MADDRISIRVVVALAIAVLAAPSVGAAQIDSFASPAPAVVNTTAGNGEVVIDGPRTAASILGSRRVTKNGNALEAGDSISVGDGAFAVVSQPFFAGDSTATTQTIYDFTGEPGGSVSFATDTGLALTFTCVNAYGCMGRTFLDAFIDIYTTGGDWQALQVHFDEVPGGSRTDFVRLSLFAGTGDLFQVTGLRNWGNGPRTTPRIDYTLTHLASVPEPASPVLLAVPLVTIAGRGRRCRSRRATG